MGTQLALFTGVVPIDVPLAGEPAPAPEVDAPPAQAPIQQMGLFDAQVRQLRAALDAVALGDLVHAASLFEGLTPEFDRTVPSLLRRVRELDRDLARACAEPLPARVAAHLELGRSLAADVDPWASFGRRLISRAGDELGPSDGVAAGRLLLEAREPLRARSALLAVPGPATAAALFALGDAELALDDRPAARRWYRDALLLDPFDPAFELVADEDVSGLPYLAEFEVELEMPRAWCAALGMVAGILPRPREALGPPATPASATAETVAMLTRVRHFVDALVRAGSPDVQKDRDALLDARRCMKRASAPLFAWYLARQAGAS